MKKQYRSKIRIILDILSSIEELEVIDGAALPTKIMYRSNLSYERLAHYLNDLVNKKLITKDADGYKLTEEGRRFKYELIRIKKFLEAFSLEL